MRFYEVRFLCDRGDDPGVIEQRAKAAAQHVDTPMKLFGVTVHNRPSAVSGGHADASVMIAVESLDDGDGEEFNELAGQMARRYGYQMTYSRKLGEKSLSLKGDPDAVDDFIEDAMGGSSDEPIKPDENDVVGDDETFTVTDIEDEADNE